MTKNKKIEYGELERDGVLQSHRESSSLLITQKTKMSSYGPRSIWEPLKAESDFDGAVVLENNNAIAQPPATSAVASEMKRWSLETRGGLSGQVARCSVRAQITWALVSLPEQQPKSNCGLFDEGEIDPPRAVSRELSFARWNQASG